MQCRTYGARTLFGIDSSALPSLCENHRSELSPAGTPELSPCMTASPLSRPFFWKRRQGTPMVVGTGSRAPFLAFISTLDPVPATLTIELGNEAQTFFLSFVP
jgi:hypothetical protein